MSSWMVSVAVAVVVGLAIAAVLMTSLRRTVLVPPDAANVAKAPAVFSRAQVATHDQPDDAWIIVAGKVYDITTYIDDHPGGSAIMNNLGQDNTKAVLEGPQHPETVPTILGMYHIGRLEDD
eukprot:CAMPEP_0197424388 /NCGR_PEP_ID=MMETSP1170-20131217/25813_1 /TAXON_ID=54406 /ORGANISM="Sarcinochrysis sp, Strain CCMP770" /LENGTH=121 /DNA_ID=CAMNT_0042951869 /DNA_START=17 /DNA_END=382 /DNA_ORIENTATION=+